MFVYYLFLSPSASAKVDKLIQKELPQGASKQQVYGFLESKGIRSRAYNAGPDPFHGLSKEDRQWKRYVVAWIYKKSYLPYKPNYTIYIYFYFDEKQNLHEVRLQNVDRIEMSS